MTDGDRNDGAMLAGVELGGTKTIAVLGRGSTILERFTVPTTTPGETLGLAAAKLREWASAHRLAGLGIASFGPIRIAAGPDGEAGVMLPTTKPGWTGARILAGLSDGLGCPVAIDTDVNGAALAEFELGRGRGVEVMCYLTIGTGVGGGVIVHGRPIHGAMHPEIGHLRLRRAPDDTFAGACSFHGDCVEGLVSGPALAARFGCDPATVPASDPRWEQVAHDLAELAGAILLTVSAGRVLVGGGVGVARPGLVARAGELLVERYGAYLPFLRAPAGSPVLDVAGLGADAGPLGALALARGAAAANATD